VKIRLRKSEAGGSAPPRAAQPPEQQELNDSTAPTSTEISGGAPLNVEAPEARASTIARQREGESAAPR